MGKLRSFRYLVQDHFYMYTPLNITPANYHQLEWEESEYVRNIPGNESVFYAG